jgi:hypothetical protein
MELKESQVFLLRDEIMRKKVERRQEENLNFYKESKSKRLQETAQNEQKIHGILKKKYSNDKPLYLRLQEKFESEKNFSYKKSLRGIDPLIPISRSKSNAPSLQNMNISKSSKLTGISKVTFDSQLYREPHTPESAFQNKTLGESLRHEGASTNYQSLNHI